MGQQVGRQALHQQGSRLRKSDGVRQRDRVSGFGKRVLGIALRTNPAVHPVADLWRCDVLANFDDRAGNLRAWRIGQRRLREIAIGSARDITVEYACCFYADHDLSRPW